MPTPLEIRIKNIQRIINVPQTMMMDDATCSALISKMNIRLAGNAALIDRKKAIQKFLGFTGKALDGIVGVNTITRIENFINQTLPILPVGAKLTVSKRALDIIVNEEIGSKARYDSKYHKPSWPGNAESGITIGIGYDLGYVTVTNFLDDWNSLPVATLNKLKAGVGKKGSAAGQYIHQNLSGVSVPWNDAIHVFYARSMPKYAKSVAAIYPGIDKLPPDAQGALLSLVYNRGTKLTGDSRREMYNIAGWVAKGRLDKIADEIRAMKRLWVGKGLGGLLKRRDAEANLVQNATMFILPQDCVIV